MLALAAVTVIPWLPASPPAAAPPPAAPPCRLAQLHVAAADAKGGIFGNGATGSLVGWVRFRNDGAACSLGGLVRVRLVGGGAPPGGQVQKRLRREAAPPDALPPPFSVRAIPHARAAQVQIWWSNWCAAPPAAVELALPPAGKVVRLPIAGTPRCDSESSPSTVSVGAFTPVVAPPTPATRLPLRVELGRRSYRVVPGGVLRYRVVLRNSGSRPFRFTRCPLYFESLGRVHEIHVLNCRPAGVLAPSEAAIFEMELRVPAMLRRGRAGLFWELGLGTFLPQSASARAVVTG